MESPDFTIRKLGPAGVRSPLHLSTVMGDQIANFVPDDAAILYDDSAPLGAPPQDSPRMELAGPRERIYFEPQRVKVAIVTCGGLCPGLNNVIRSLVLELHYHYKVPEIWGIRYGYWGMVPENGNTAIRLTPGMVEEIHTQGGTFLGSSRGPQKIEAMLDFLAARKVNVLFTVGGDGTQRGALELSEAATRRGQELAVVGIPKTIDNDLAYTERTFGFETACATARDVLRAGHAEAWGARYGVCVVKLMGRESGFIAAAASLASGDVNFVLIPEVSFDLEGPRGFLAALEKRLRERLHALVAVAEGAGQELLRKPGREVEKDPSGNPRLGDIGVFLRDRIRDYGARCGLPISVRYIDPSYVIRSRAANASDHVLCTALAQNAVHAAMSGRTELVVGLWHGSFVHVPMKTAVAFRKKVDPDGFLWLSVVQATGQPAVMRNDA